MSNANDHRSTEPIIVTMSEMEADNLSTTCYRNFGPEQPDRFESVGDGSDDVEAILTNPAFADGTMYQFERYLDAHVFRAVHRAVGHRAEMVWDLAEDGGYWVLSSKPWH